MNTCKGCRKEIVRIWSLDEALCFSCGSAQAPQQLTTLRSELAADRALLAAIEEFSRFAASGGHFNIANSLPQAAAEAKRIDELLAQVEAANWSRFSPPTETSSSRRHRQAGWARAALKELRKERDLF